VLRRKPYEVEASGVVGGAVAGLRLADERRRWRAPLGPHGIAKLFWRRHDSHARRKRKKLTPLAGQKKRKKKKN
jgi:hypothetical protein